MCAIAYVGFSRIIAANQLPWRIAFDQVTLHEKTDLHQLSLEFQILFVWH